MCIFWKLNVSLKIICIVLLLNPFTKYWYSLCSSNVLHSLSTFRFFSIFIQFHTCRSGLNISSTLGCLSNLSHASSVPTANLETLESAPIFQVNYHATDITNEAESTIASSAGNIGILVVRNGNLLVIQNHCMLVWWSRSWLLGLSEGVNVALRLKKMETTGL